MKDIFTRVEAFREKHGRLPTLISVPNKVVAYARKALDVKLERADVNTWHGDGNCKQMSGVYPETEVRFLPIEGYILE